LRAAIRTLRKTARALALVLAVAACQNAGVAPIGTATKPPEPPLPVAAPPSTVMREELPPPAVPTPGQAVQGAKAALLVPLSGPAAAAGQHLWNAAQLAVFDVGGPGFTVQPIDTKGTPEGAAAAARQAIAQGAGIILGPLFSSEVKAVAPLARQAGINVVAFTTDHTAAGDGTFILGVLPRSQVARVVGQARAQGIGRFGVLAPDSEYGRAMAEALQETVRASGGLLTRAEFYDPRGTDPSEAIRRLGGGGAVPFEALLLPDEGVRLKAAAALLPVHGVDPDRVQLLGTLAWNDPATAQEPALAGGWYAAPPLSAHAEFAGNYRRNFNTPPPAIASLGYDATALAAVLAQRQGPGFGGVASITNTSGFAGVDGIFRLLPDGTNQRGLAVMEVSRSGAREIAPAPATFADRVY
jgi:branched-chain amino acid transport system substrate-binding protein